MTATFNNIFLNMHAKKEPIYRLENRLNNGALVSENELQNSCQHAQLDA